MAVSIPRGKHHEMEKIVKVLIIAPPICLHPAILYGTIFTRATSRTTHSVTYCKGCVSYHEARINVEETELGDMAPFDRTDLEHVQRIFKAGEHIDYL